MPFVENVSGPLLYLKSSKIDAVHAFTSRLGGVSEGIFESLNLGLNVGDDPERVRENFRRLSSALGFNPSRIVFSRQVHGATVRLALQEDARAPFDPIPYEADALVTAERGLPLVVFSADCVPILLFDPVRVAAGAVHAGWRGTASDIAGAAVRKMELYFGCRPQDVRAAIGPCISQCCFETGPDVAEALTAALRDDAGACIRRRGGKYAVDLKEANRMLLIRAGLLRDNIDVCPDCTSCSPERYWSHRATAGRRGSQAAVILLR